MAVASRLALPVEPDRQGQGMRVESLGLGETDRRGGKGGEARRVAADERGSLDKVEDAETRGKPRAARGRQHMVGPGDVVADRLGRPAAEKDRAGVTHLL